MHDFIQNLSFNSSAPFTPAPVGSESQRDVLRSFTPAPTFRPSPRRRDLKSKIPNRKSKILP